MDFVTRFPDSECDDANNGDDKEDNFEGVHKCWLG